MSPEHAIHLIRHTLLLVLELASPLLITALLIGLLFSLMQSFTKLQESSFTFVPKLLVVIGGLAILMPWMFKLLSKFTHHLMVYQWDQLIQSIDYVL